MRQALTRAFSGVRKARPLMPVVVRTRDTTLAAYYEALGYVEGDQLQRKLEKNRKAPGQDDSGA